MAITKAVLLQLKGIKLRLQFEPDNFRFAGPVMRGGGQFCIKKRPPKRSFRTAQRGAVQPVRKPRRYSVRARASVPVPLAKAHRQFDSFAAICLATYTPLAEA